MYPCTLNILKKQEVDKDPIYTLYYWLNCPKPAWAKKPSAALASIFENRRQFDRAADYLKRSTRDLRRQGRRQGPAPRPDRRQLGPLRAGADPARRPRGHGRVPLPQRPAGRVRGPRDQGREAAGRREGLHLVQSPQAARLAEDQHRRHRLSAGRARTRSSTSGGRSPSGRWTSSRAETTSTSGSPSPRRCRSPARIWSRPRWTAATPASSSSGSTTRHRQEAARRQDLLLRGRRRHRQADRRRPTSSSSAGSRSMHDKPPRVSTSITKKFAEFTDADGQVMSRPPSSEPQDLPVARHRHGRDEGRFAYLGFTNVWYGQLVRRRVQRHEGLHDHRPAGLSARAEGEVQVLGRARPVRHGGRLRLRRPDVHRRDPQSQGREDRREELRPTPTAASKASTSCRPTPRWASTRSSSPDHGGGSVPRRGVQEARVRSHGRRPQRAGHARREDHRHDQGQVLLRLAGHQGQGEVQGQPHQLRRAVVSASGRGTGSTGRATGGSPTTTPGIPAGATGAACGRCRSGGRSRSSRPNWSPIRKWRSAPTAR